MNSNRRFTYFSWVVLTTLGTVNCSSDPDNTGSGGSTSQAGTPSTSGGSAGTSSSGGSSAGTSLGGGGAGTAGTSAGTSSGGSASAGTSSGGNGGASGGSGGAAGSGTSGSGSGGSSGSSAGSGGSAGTGGGSSGGFTLSSSKLAPGAMFATEYTCASGNAGKSIPLTWTAGPSGTLSYAIVMLDTDVMPNGFYHWVVWDIPAGTTSLPEGLATDAMLSMPAGAKQKGGQGSGYLGPCPNGMSHTYKFTVYAMDVATLPGAMTSMMTSALATAVETHDLASATFSGVSDAKRP